MLILPFLLWSCYIKQPNLSSRYIIWILIQRWVTLHKSQACMKPFSPSYTPKSIALQLIAILNNRHYPFISKRLVEQIVNTVILQVHFTWLTTYVSSISRLLRTLNCIHTHFQMSSFDKVWQIFHHLFI